MGESPSRCLLSGIQLRSQNLLVSSQPRDTGRCLGNIYNRFPHACQQLGKGSLHYVSRLLLCSNVCPSKCKTRGQQTFGHLSKSLLGFGARMNDSSLASGFHVLSSTQHETLGPVTEKEEWDQSPANRYRSQVLGETLACVLSAGDFILVLCNSWGAHTTQLSG